MSMQSSLGRVRGLGSAKKGVEHWWVQRLTAIALVPLTIWFVASVAAISGADYETMRAWVSSPVNASLLTFTIVMTFYHGYLGLQVIIEDYIHHEGAKFAALIAVMGVSILLTLICIFSVLILMFGG